MGAWDATAFGNDEALDMVLDLLEHSDSQVYLSQILGHAKETGYLEATVGSQMVAMAALIAASKNKDSIAIPDNAAGWIQANPNILQPLAATALEAIARVRGENSELRELWEETDELAAWIADLDRISAALH